MRRRDRLDARPALARVRRRWLACAAAARGVACWRVAQNAGAVRRRALRGPAVDLRAHQVQLTVSEADADARLGYWDEPWAIDAPAAEQNLSRRAAHASRPIEVADPIVLTLDDERLWQHPWIYIVEPSNLVLTDKRGGDPARVPAARRHADDGRFPRPVRMGADPASS